MTSLTLSETSQVESVLLKLPLLPSSVRYWDDYLDTWHIIRDLSANDRWLVKHDGIQVSFKFDFWPSAYRTLVKLVIVEMFSRLDVTSVQVQYHHLEACAEKLGVDALMIMLAGLRVHEVRDQWLTSVMPKCTNTDARSLKSVLHSLCI